MKSWHCTFHLTSQKFYGRGNKTKKKTEKYKNLMDKSELGRFAIELRKEVVDSEYQKFCWLWWHVGPLTRPAAFKVQACRMGSGALPLAGDSSVVCSGKLSFGIVSNIVWISTSFRLHPECPQLTLTLYSNHQSLKRTNEDSWGWVWVAGERVGDRQDVALGRRGLLEGCGGMVASKFCEYSSDKILAPSIALLYLSSILRMVFVAFCFLLLVSCLSIWRL